jgi:hypothetical protein
MIQDGSPADGNSRATAPAILAGVPGVAGAALVTCGTACAGACAPPILGLLGLSSSGAALLSWMGWLRPAFFAVSAISLGVAFHRAYRRSPGATRATPFVASRGFVWLMAAVTLALFALPYAAPAAQQETTPSPCTTPCSKTDCPLQTKAPRNL